jgi:AAA family ATP:ADP antiporter
VTEPTAPGEPTALGEPTAPGEPTAAPPAVSPWARGLVLAATAYLMTFGYELARPASESVFLGAYGSRALPLVWLGVAAAVVPAVALHRRLVARLEVARVFAVTSALTALGFTTALGAVGMGWPGAPAGLYVLKDVYVVLLIEAFWSVASLTHGLGHARWSYGVYLFAGSLGGASAGGAVGSLAARLGTHGALWLVVPTHLALALLAERGLRRVARAGVEAPRAIGRGAWRDGWVIVKESPYLGRLLALVAVVQVVLTLVDYGYNQSLEASFPDVDARTAASGRVYAGLELGAAVLQLSAGLILRVLGAPATLVAIPLVLLAPLSLGVAAPTFWAAGVAKAAGKALDYSLLRAAKELFYVPLGADAKLHGKALVDILGYRVAKGVASLGLLGLVAAGIDGFVPTLVLVGVGAWALLALSAARAFRRRVARADELG